MNIIQSILCATYHMMLLYNVLKMDHTKKNWIHLKIAVPLLTCNVPGGLYIDRNSDRLRSTSNNKVLMSRNRPFCLNSDPVFLDGHSRIQKIYF